MRTDHINICKFETADDDGYKVVKSKIMELIQGKTKIQEQPVSVLHSQILNDSISILTRTSVWNQVRAEHIWGL
jgi:hypothetical protein